MKADIRRAGPEALELAKEIHDREYVASGMYAAVFNEYVARSVEAFAANWDDARDGVWVADGGYVAVCHRDDGLAQLRYLYVHPTARGKGMGRALIQHAVDFARDAGYPGIMLWTMEGLDAAARLYADFGWKLEATEPAPWHATLMQQRYELKL